MAEVEAEEVVEKKTRHRSPAYPTVGLREAVERVGKLYKADGKAGAPPRLAATHIGFATAHGQALSVLAALKKFGLVTEVNGRIVPSQRAIEILNLPTSDPRRVQAVKDAALSPEVYRELIEQHRDTGWPADDVLQADLITYRNFNPKAVAGFVKDFKDTLEFAGLSDLSVLGSAPEEESLVAPEAQSVQQIQDQAKQLGSTIPPQNWVLSVPRGVRAELKIVGQDVQPQDLERLKEQIDFLRNSFEVLIPITCDKCKTSLTLSVSSSKGFGYMNEHAFACPVCGTRRSQLLPGSVRAITISQSPAEDDPS